MPDDPYAQYQAPQGEQDPYAAYGGTGSTTTQDTPVAPFMQRLWQNIKDTPSMMGQEAIGALKGAGKTAYNIGDIASRVTSLGIGPPNPPSPAFLEPSNLPQKVGQAAERVGEYFIPGGAISKGAKAIEDAVQGVRGARALAGAGRAALEGISAGGVNYAQTEDPQSALKAAETAGSVSGGVQAVGAAIPSAERLYLSALKPKKPVGVQSPQGVLQAQRAVAQTGLREGVPVSNYGLSRAEEITDQLNKEISQTIANKSQKLGPVIQPQAVASRIDQIKPQFQAQTNPESDVAALDASKAEYLRKHTPQPQPVPTLYGPNNQPLPPPPPTQPIPETLAEAQGEKQATYTQLRKKYGELGSADTEAQKALARGLKEEILLRAPELAKLNARDSSMIELENQLANFVKRNNTRDILDLKSAFLGSVMAGAGGAGEGYHTGGWRGAATHGAIAAALGAAMGNPAVKSSLAIALNRASGVGQAAVSAAPKIAAGVQSTPPISPGLAKGGIITTKGKKAAGSVEDRVRGSANVPLSPEGDQEALQLGQALAKRGFGKRGDTITPGVLDRAKQTGSLIAQSAPQARMLPPDPSLDTWRLGAIEGQPTDKVHAQIEQLVNNPDQVPPPGDVSSAPPESFNQFKQRYLPPWKARYAAYLKQPNARHILITHGRGMRLLKSWVSKGMPDDLSIDPKQLLDENDRPADVHRIAPGPKGRPTISEVNPAQAGRIKQGLLAVRHASTPWNAPKGETGKSAVAQWKRGGVAALPNGLQQVPFLHA